MSIGTMQLAQIHKAWEQLGGGQLDLQRRPPTDLGNRMVCLPVGDGDDRLWLVAELPTNMPERALAVLQSWTQLMGQLQDEREAADSLTAELAAAWSRLSFLHQVARLGRTLGDADVLLHEALRMAAQTVEAANGFVLLELGADNLDVTWIFPDFTIIDYEPIVHLLDLSDFTVVKNGELASMRAFGRVADIRSFMGRRLGLSSGTNIYVGLVNQVNDHFNAGDIQLFESLIEQVQNMLEADSLYSQQRDAENLERELEIAGKVQASFLPLQLPQLGGYQIAAEMISASRIGGDFYDVYQLPHGKTGFVVCDVAGKGVSAALLAANVRSTIRSELKTEDDPGKILQNTNVQLAEDMSRIESFATAIVACISPHEAEVRYASAGHTMPLWVQAGRPCVRMLPSTTLPLGVLPDLDDSSMTACLQPNDVLVLYSDGLTEVENLSGQLLGIAGVTDVLLAVHWAPADFILRSLLEVSRLHRNYQAPQDDLTLLVIKFVDPQVPPARYLSRLHWQTDLGVLSRVGREVSNLKDELGRQDAAAETWLMQVELSLTEIVSNIIIHSHNVHLDGQIHGLLALYEDCLRVELFDSGHQFDPTKTPPTLDYDPLDPPVGGYGLHIVRQVVETMEYSRLPEGYNHWQLVWRLPPMEVP